MLPKFSLEKFSVPIIESFILSHLNSTAATMPGLTVGCISYKKIGPNTIEMNRFTVDTGMY